LSTEPNGAPQALPDPPNLRHLKDQAKDLLKVAKAASLADAQFQIARLYGFASWPKLKAHVDSLEEVGQLKQAIDSNDFARVKALMTRNPALHRAPLGYGKDGHSLTMLDCANGHQKEAVDEREENCQREGEADEEARPHGKNS
jgi:hypothetical protein